MSIIAVFDFIFEILPSSIGNGEEIKGRHYTGILFVLKEQEWSHLVEI